jgi:hypothetical protein
MHDCPECGQACHCGGDIDDAAVMSSEWIYWNCECCANEDGDEYHDYSDSFDDTFPVPQCVTCGRGKESVSDLYTCIRCGRMLCERCGEAEAWAFNDECCQGCPSKNEDEE